MYFHDIYLNDPPKPIKILKMTPQQNGSPLSQVIYDQPLKIFARVLILIYLPFLSFFLDRGHQSLFGRPWSYKTCYCYKFQELSAFTIYTQSYAQHWKWFVFFQWQGPHSSAQNDYPCISLQQLRSDGEWLLWSFKKSGHCEYFCFNHE